MRQNRVSGDLADARPLLNPRSVAVVGASPDSRKTMSSATLIQLQAAGYTGNVYPINPKYDAIGDYRCYPDLRSLPEVPDAVVIVVPAAAVPPVLADCAELGVPLVNIVSAGVTDEALAPFPTEHTRLLGPESMGVINVHDRYVSRAATNGIPLAQVRGGGIAVITQSGAAGNTLYNLTASLDGGMAYTVNAGRSHDLTLWNVAATVIEDPRVTVLMCAAEGIGDERAFVSVAQRCHELGKQMLCVVVGYSEAAQEAVRSHSGGIAGSAKVDEQVMRRLGVIRCADYSEMARLAVLFEKWGRPDTTDQGSLAVIAYSGGEAALIADTAARLGVELAPPSPALAGALARSFPEITPHNPLDPTSRVLADPARVAELFEILLSADDAYSEVLVATPVYGPTIAEARVGVLAESVQRLGAGRRIAISTWRARGLTEQAEQTLRDANLTYLGTSLETLAVYHDWASVTADGDDPLLRKEGPPWC